MKRMTYVATRNTDTAAEMTNAWLMSIWSTRYENRRWNPKNAEHTNR